MVLGPGFWILVFGPQTLCLGFCFFWSYGLGVVPCRGEGAHEACVSQKLTPASSTRPITLPKTQGPAPKNQDPKTQDPKPIIQIQAKDRTQEQGCWVLSNVFWILGSWVFGHGYWVVGFGCWCWLLVFVFWDSGFLDLAYNDCWVLGAWSWGLGVVAGQDEGTHEAYVVASSSQHPARICTWVFGRG